MTRKQESITLSISTSISTVKHNQCNLNMNLPESQVTKLISEKYNAKMNAILALAKKLEEKQAKLEIFLQTAIAQPIAKCDGKWYRAKVYIIEKWEHDRFLVVDENQNREIFSREELIFTEKELLQVDNYLTLAILSQNSHL